VQAILADRIDRLGPEEKRLLQSAAVIGREFSLPLLQAVMGASEEDLSSGLARLQGAEFLYESSLFPEIEYTFKHVLTQEVAYEGLLQGRGCASRRSSKFRNALGRSADRRSQHF
jgi:predicted ATPase